ncbi:hypothetical protein BG000_006890 [Podila horticola]|nr:hypothetical protein BG000_006890 [Podila horticola]
MMVEIGHVHFESTYGRTDDLTLIYLEIELIKMVAYHLQNNRYALHACLLVSRAWSQAAVEFLYKAEHMMNDFDFQHLSTLSFASSSASLSVDTTVLKNADELGDPLRSRYRPILSSLDAAHAINGTVNDTDDPTYKVCLSPDMVTQLLLQRTLDASLLHDASCAYDYISYLNKISCPWFVGLIQDWNLFCSEWRGTKARDGHLDDQDPLPSLLEGDPSIARQEHCFNRLVRKVSSRCAAIDEFRSAHMVQSDTLVYSIRHFQNLTWIDLKDSQDLNDNVFDAIAGATHALSYIRLPGAKMTHVSTQAVTNMLLAQEKNTLCQFKVIHGSNIFDDNSIFKAIGEHHGGSMKRLTLAICDLEESGLQEYGPLCSQLVSLNLEYSSGVTNEAVLPILDACRHIAKLDLTETDCTQTTIQALSMASDSTTPQPSRFASMKRLILNNIDSPFTTNIFVPLADACHNLEELHMNSILADTFQDFSQFIAKMKVLRDLDIGNVFPEFNDANLTSLVDSLPHLRWLSIANTQITNASLVYLAEHAKHLCDLCILGCDQVTKDGVLEFLDKLANKAAFRRLDLTYCRLDDQAMEEIRERTKWISLERGLAEMIEVDGDDQFADSLVEDEDENEEDGRDEGVDDQDDAEVLDMDVLEELDEEHDISQVLGLEVEGMAGLQLEDGGEAEFGQDMEDETGEEEEDLSDFSNTSSDLEDDDDN